MEIPVMERCVREENCQSLAIKFCRDEIIQEPSQTNVMLVFVTPGNPCDTGICHSREPLWVKRLAMPKVVSFIPSASSWLLTNPSCFAGTESCPGLILAPARVRQPEGCSDCDAGDICGSKALYSLQLTRVEKQREPTHLKAKPAPPLPALATEGKSLAWSCHCNALNLCPLVQTAPNCCGLNEKCCSEV